jgi:hypothetical protein
MRRFCVILSEPASRGIPDPRVPILSQNVSERGLFGCHPERKFAAVKDQREAIFVFISKWEKAFIASRRSFVNA